MIKLILQFIIAFISVYITALILPNFDLNLAIEFGKLEFWIVALSIGGGLFLITKIIRPIMKVLLFPLILLSFGIFSIIINIVLLKLYDIVFDEVVIQGIWPLLLGSILIGIINSLFEFLID